MSSSCWATTARTVRTAAGGASPTSPAKAGSRPRAGVVPRYYLVGKALFVYWPSGFEFPWPQSLKNFLIATAAKTRRCVCSTESSPLRWIPNVGQLRFIYGGSAKDGAARGRADGGPESQPGVTCDSQRLKSHVCRHEIASLRMAASSAALVRPSLRTLALEVKR